MQSLFVRRPRRHAAVSGLLLLAVTIGVCGSGAAALAVTAATAAPASVERADLIVTSVAVPYPPGTSPGSGLQLDAVVANEGGGQAPERSRVGFFLSTQRTLDKQAIGISPLDARHADVTPRLRPGQRDRGSEDGVVPLGTHPGIYWLIACADVGHQVPESHKRNNCRTLSQRLAIENPPAAVAPSSAAASSPITEYFPEKGGCCETPWKVKKIGKCPASAHGQGFPTTNAFYTDKTSDCAWVTTGNIYPSNDDPDAQKGRNFGLYYCPSDFPYPFEVAVGFDPMWEDIDGGIPAYGAPASTRAVSGTKYNVISNQPGDRALYSYPGSKGISRGYVYFSVGVKKIAGDVTGNAGTVRYLCSDTRATSYLR